MVYEGFVDILLSGDTDIEFLDGDIRTTQGIDAMKRELLKRLITEKGDWPLYPNEGASANIFVGEPNTRDTSIALKKHLMERLSSAVYPANLDVKIIPINFEEVSVIIKIILGNQMLGAINLKVDYINGITYPGFDDKIDTIVPSRNVRINETGKIRQYNKYWDQIRKQ